MNNEDQIKDQIKELKEDIKDLKEETKRNKFKNNLIISYIAISLIATFIINYIYILMNN